MFSSILLGSLWFEAGSWFGLALAKFGSRDKNQNLLINGYDVRTSLPVADNLISQQTIHATKAQRMVSSRLSQLIRSIANTKAFEQLLLKQIMENWPGNSKMSTGSKLFI